MPEGTVTGRKLSKKGTPVVIIDGQDYYAGNTDVGGLTVGDRIAFTCTSFADGKLWGIDKGWKLITAAPKYPPSTPQSKEIPAPRAPEPVQKGLGLMSEGERLCVSNWVGQAIAAKTVTEPEQLEKWICAARNALRSQSE